MNFSRPVIERFGVDVPIARERIDAANKICRYFYSGRNINLRHEYYEAVTSLLSRRDSERIILYLPFDELIDAPNYFRDAYLDVWYGMLGVHDARENFHEGDTFELDARPNGEVERVVKCAHLIPWMIAAGYITCRDLLDILNHNSDDVILLQSFKDTWEYIRTHNILTEREIKGLEDTTSTVKPREKANPLYVSPKRIAWLQERKKPPGKLLTPNAKLEGPFSPNLESLKDRIVEIEEFLKPDEIILVGGSQLKGYGTVDSDLDVWKLHDLEHDQMMYPGSPDASHIYFNAIWIGGKNVRNLDEISRECCNSYVGRFDRLMSIERIESDLLQYRLLHKGYSRFTAKDKFDTSSYRDMDGDCPFYDDAYRQIATMLYAKYVVIPQSRR